MDAEGLQEALGGGRGRCARRLRRAASDASTGRSARCRAGGDPGPAPHTGRGRVCDAALRSAVAGDSTGEYVRPPVELLVAEPPLTEATLIDAVLRQNPTLDE